MTTRTGKIWGTTLAVKTNSAVEMHHASIKAGFRCSKHYHARKWNGFYVLSGKLAVRVWQPSGLEDVTVLEAGQYTEVPPMLVHRFECIDDCECIELYWADINGEDIHRLDEGGPINAG